jgi:hypothetical protein
VFRKGRNCWLRATALKLVGWRKYCFEGLLAKTINKQDWLRPISRLLSAVFETIITIVKIFRIVKMSVVESSVGRALSFSHVGPRFKSRGGHLFVSLLICDLIDC